MLHIPTAAYLNMAAAVFSLFCALFILNTALDTTKRGYSTWWFPPVMGALFTVELFFVIANLVFAYILIWH